MPLYLWAGAMHQDKAHTQTGKQIKVMGQLGKFTVRYDFTAERDHESAATEGVDIRCNRTKPGNEFSRRHGAIRHVLSVC